MTLFELGQWAADTERLLITGLSSEDPNNPDDPLACDEFIIDAVIERCEERFGPRLGYRYFATLLTTLPDRRPELFPELRDFQ